MSTEQPTTDQVHQALIEQRAVLVGVGANQATVSYVEEEITMAEPGSECRDCDHAHFGFIRLEDVGRIVPFAKCDVGTVRPALYRCWLCSTLPIQ